MDAGRRRGRRRDDALHPDRKGDQRLLLAYGQNGERLRPEQGYPLRLLLPGYEGNTNVKWLAPARDSDAEQFTTREETSKYTRTMPDGDARSSLSR